MNKLSPRNAYGCCRGRVSSRTERAFRDLQ